MVREFGDEHVDESDAKSESLQAGNEPPSEYTYVMISNNALKKMNSRS